MKKVFFFFILLFIPTYVYALDYPELHSSNIIIYNLTDNELLYEKNSEDIISIASLTKITTTITAIELISNLDDKVVITSKMIGDVAYDASVAGLKVGDEITYRDLLYASILPSGADATVALSYSLSSGVDGFVKEMNDLAMRVGLSNTNYVNVTGLDNDNHYSTAKDVLMILKYALNNPLFREIYTTNEYTLSNDLKVSSTTSYYNKDMKLDISRIIGAKTGYTLNAGLCMSSLINSNSKDIIIITLGAPYVYGSFYNLIDALELIKFLDNNYNIELIATKESLVDTLKVENSDFDLYQVYLDKDIMKYLPIDYNPNDIEIKYTGKKVLSFRNKNGDKLGHIDILYKGKLIERRNVYLDKDIKLKLLNNIGSELVFTYFIIIESLIFILFYLIENVIIK